MGSGSLAPVEHVIKDAIVDEMQLSAVSKYFMYPDGHQNTFPFGAMVRHCGYDELPVWRGSDSLGPFLMVSGWVQTHFSVFCGPFFFFFFFHSRWASGTPTPLAKFGYFWHIFFIPDGWVAYPVLFKILCVHICDINSHMRFLNWKQAYYGKLIYLGWISETQMAIAPNIFSKSKPILKFWY